MELHDVYMTLVDEYVGTYCTGCLEAVSEANDHIDLTIVDAYEGKGCDRCGKEGGQ